MKSAIAYLVLSLAAIFLGTLAGTGWSWFEYSNTEEHFFENQWNRVDPTSVKPEFDLSGTAPQQQFDGVVGQPASHDFIIKNSGSSDLELTLAEHSENIEVNLPETQTVLPGRTFPITLTLSDTGEPGEFEGFAVITTNDPSEERKQIRFSIRVKIVESPKNGS
ncbi:MAG: DUF1573 domain-containing protein [Mariniblastus sp.]|nr:DUF1573 domain-containing protein [Mariniblastus sp.]